MNRHWRPRILTKTPRLGRMPWVLGMAVFAAWISARPLDELPGEEVVLQEPSQAAAPAKSGSPGGTMASWLSPSIDDQLSRDQTLLTVSKGALFVPTFSEPRREPEVGVYSPSGRLIRNGLTGTRILLDSGIYDVRVGSGSQKQQMRYSVHIEEGHTRVITPGWGGLLVETITPDGDYFEGQYEVIRIDRNGWYGRGRGLGDERLQDIKVWLLPPGIYRLGKIGDPANSLRSYITVEIHSGELQSVELVFADASPGSDIVAGGLKALEARSSAGRNWTYGLRAGGNLAFISSIDKSDTRKEIGQLSSDIRLRIRYDQSKYFGLNEITLRNNFEKQRGSPINVVSDEGTARTTWVRRINSWIGPYVRAQASTHFFPRKAQADTVHVVSVVNDAGVPGGVRIDTLSTDSSGTFRFEPPLYPLRLSEGMGVNLDLLNFTMIELTTQVGLASHQKISRGDYGALSRTEFYSTETESDIGLETLINARIRLINTVTLDIRTELFAPNARLGETQLSDLELDLRLTLSRFVELGYLYQVNELTETAANPYPSSHNLSIRFNLNY